MEKKHPLTLLDECSSSFEVLNELVESFEFLQQLNEKNSKSEIQTLSSHQCPRCDFIQKSSFSIPYCSYCNWDNLADPSHINNFAEFAA